jgi:hypothetical protein
VFRVAHEPLQLDVVPLLARRWMRSSYVFHAGRWIDADTLVGSFEESDLSDHDRGEPG